MARELSLEAKEEEEEDNLQKRIGKRRVFHPQTSSRDTFLGANPVNEIKNTG